MGRLFGFVALLGFVCGASFHSGYAEIRHVDPAAAERGLQNLLNRTYQDPVLNELLFDNLWRTWEPEPRAEAEQSSPGRRREMTLDRYGFTESPMERGGLPMQMTRQAKSGMWSPNCLLCHGGQVMGQPIAGKPNHQLDLTSFYEDLTILQTVLSGRPAPERPIDFGGIFNLTKGTSNAFRFSADLLMQRDANLDLISTPVSFGEFGNFDVDPPAWWNLKFKRRLYHDGFAEVSARSLMQFVLSPSNSGELVRSWLPDYEDVLQWIDSIPAPRYPGPIRQDLAKQGHAVFDVHCATCHGTPSEYPEARIPVGMVGTDPLRLSGMTPEFRTYFQASWLGDYGRNRVEAHPVGYLAPPLAGIWASAPYFHNGSTPTLYDVLHPETRPLVWKITDAHGYDHQRMGVVTERFDAVPAGIRYGFEKRKYFDTRLPGKSASGHLFPNALNEEEKEWVLEYLKTL